jgi:hypothetical protein
MRRRRGERHFVRRRNRDVPGGLACGQGCSAGAKKNPDPVKDRGSV